MTRSNLNFVWQNPGEAPRVLFHYHNGDQYPEGLLQYFGIEDFLTIERLWTPDDFRAWIRGNYKVAGRKTESLGNGMTLSLLDGIRDDRRDEMLGLVEAAETHDGRMADFRVWVTTVRDPAEQRAEGIRAVEASNRQAHAEYQIASLPDGRFAVHTGCTYAGYAYNGHPWEAFPSRDDCIAAFLRRARQFFQRVPDGCASESHRQGRVQILALLQESLFGFVEPAPRTGDELPPRSRNRSRR